MTKVAVTGGAGFIGTNLVRRLISKGHEVTIIDDLSTGQLSNVDMSKSSFHQISITDKAPLAEALTGCQTIFHLAARGSVPRSIKNPIATHDVNATGTLNVLEIARYTGAHVIFSSSSSVYGRNLSLPKTETMWLAPMTPYAASKLAAEAYVQAYASTYEIPTTLLRFFNVFGPLQRHDHEYAAVLPKWIWLAMQGKPIEVYGDGETSRDFTFIDTVVDIGMLAMEKNVTTIGAVNLAYGNRITLNEIIEIMRAHFSELQVIFRPSRAGDIRESQNSPVLLRELFQGVEPKDFKIALEETIKWFKTYLQT